MAKVMIVDDSAYARRVHCAILQRSGHSVIEASTGSGAIELFCEARPDVVLLDLSMEDISGIDVLRTLREIDSMARIIVVSADVQRSTETTVMAAGAERFLAKPADEARLLEAIAEVAKDAGL